MATNNGTNNKFPSGLTATGTTNINSSGSGATTIGSSSSGALTIAANANSSIALNNASFSLNTAGGTVTIGTDATAKTILIGSSATTSFITTGVLSINSGTSSTNSTITKNNSSIMDITDTGGGGIYINSTGLISFGNSGIGSIVKIGTDAAAMNITIGNTSISSTMNIVTGTGGITIASGAVARTVTIGNTTGATQINIDCGTGGLLLNSITVSTSVTMPIGSYVVPTNGSQSQLTLPTTITVGGFFKVTGQGAGGWKIIQNSGQTIHSTATSTTTGATGSLASGGKYDSVELVCIVANTDFTIVNSVGTLAFV